MIYIDKLAVLLRVLNGFATLIRLTPRKTAWQITMIEGNNNCERVKRYIAKT